MTEKGWKKWKPGADVLTTWKRQRINFETKEVGENVEGEFWRPPTEYRTDYQFRPDYDRGSCEVPERQESCLQGMRAGYERRI